MQEIEFSKIIEYRGVEIHRNEHVVLKNVDFSVEPGEMLYLVGRVGSGKSSLLKTIYGEVPVYDGEARVFDYDLRELRKRQIPFLRRRIGIVFQDFQLLTDRTVRDNLEFVLQATGWKNRIEREDRIEQVLGEVGMTTKAFKLPHELSGGEQQRIVIARALLNRPKLILADEPTGNLDPKTSDQIMARLYEITRQSDTAVIMATHNLSLTKAYPGRILSCENKKLHPVDSVLED